MRASKTIQPPTSSSDTSTTHAALFKHTPMSASDLTLQIEHQLTRRIDSAIPAPLSTSSSLDQAWLHSLTTSQLVDSTSRKSISDEGTRISNSNTLLRETLIKLGMTNTVNGICCGLTKLSTHAFLTSNIHTFYNRLRLLLHMTPSFTCSLLSAIDHDAAVLTQNIDDLLPGKQHFAQTIKRLTEIRHTAIQSKLYLSAFLGALATASDPSSYYNLFDGKGYPSAEINDHKEYQPQFTTDTPDRAPKQFRKLSATLTQAEWSTIFAELAAANRHDFSIQFRCYRHDIAIHFNAKTQQWLFIDANTLPGSLIDASQPESVASSVFKAFEILYPRVKRSHTLEGSALLLCQSQFVNEAETDFDKIVPAIPSEHAKIDDDYSPLCFACYRDDTASIESLLAHGTNPNQFTTSGNTPLCVACKQGNVNAIRLLLAAGANANQRTLFGCPLYIASYNNQALAVATLANVVDINQQFRGGYTALTLACKLGHTSTVKVLLAAGASIHQTTAQGLTPLRIAMESGHAELSSLLLHAKFSCETGGLAASKTSTEASLASYT